MTRTIIALSILFGATCLKGFDFKKLKSQGKSIGTLEEEQKSKNIEILLKTKSCPGCNLQTNGKELRNIDLKDAQLSGANLTLSDLSGSMLAGANLTKANLSRANLMGAKISHDTLFSGAILSDATWINGQICEENSIGICITPDVQKMLTQKSCSGCSLVGADLSGKNLQDANLENADLTDANLTGAYMPGAYLKGARLINTNFTNADLYRADFTNAVLNNTNFTGAKLYETKLPGASLAHTNFSGQNLIGIQLYGADVTEAKFIQANMDHAGLNGARCVRADFSYANLTGAFLANADLTGANFTGANLTGADLSSARIEGAIFTGATLAGARWIDGKICTQKSVGVCKILPPNAHPADMWARSYDENTEKWYAWTEVKAPSAYVGTCWPGSLLHRKDACDDWCGSGNYIGEECSENKTYCKCDESIEPGSKLARAISGGFKSAISTVKDASVEGLSKGVNLLGQGLSKGVTALDEASKATGLDYVLEKTKIKEGVNYAYEKGGHYVVDYAGKGVDYAEKGAEKALEAAFNCVEDPAQCSKDIGNAIKDVWEAKKKYGRLLSQGADQLEKAPQILQTQAVQGLQTAMIDGLNKTLIKTLVEKTNLIANKRDEIAKFKKLIEDNKNVAIEVGKGSLAQDLIDGFNAADDALKMLWSGPKISTAQDPQTIASNKILFKNSKDSGILGELLYQGQTAIDDTTTLIANIKDEIEQLKDKINYEPGVKGFGLTLIKRMRNLANFLNP